MTRFQLSSSLNHNEHASSPSTALQFGGHDTRGGATLHSRISGRGGSTRSARLVTISPDGQSIHSLIRSDVNNRFIIETHRLPMQHGGPSESHESDNLEQPSVIRTQLPDDIRQALDIDPPVELVCVEGESSRSPNSGNDVCKIPRLCVYTRKSVFLLQLGYDKSEESRGFGGSPTPFGTSVNGSVLSFKEPFYRQLDQSQKISIIRIRPAPQRYADYVAVSSMACMACLVYDADVNEYSILLHHSDGSITEPANWKGPEEVSSLENTEGIVDFCFGQSAGLSIFSSMSILLLKASGEVMAISPIVFDGTVVAHSFIQEGLDYLQAVRQQLPDRNCAKFRQYKAAEQFILDVFGVTRLTNLGPGASFCSAQILVPQKADTAAVWPVSLQGPVLLQNVDENTFASVAAVIEPFGSSDQFAGIAIGKSGCDVDFAVISPTCLIPRFAFESCTDAYELNDEQYKRSAIVERVRLREDQSDDSGVDLTQICIVKDPIANNLLHYATCSFVGTISTNIMKITSRALTNEPIRDPVRTTAWSSINSSSVSKSAVIGIDVSNDANLGHLLIARLSDGSVEQVNITESHYLHELEALLKEDNSNLLICNTLPTNAPEPSVTPLYEKIEPLVKRVTAGLANFSKIVGTETSYRDIQPDALAVAIDLNRRCDTEVVLPLLELKTIVDTRRHQLKTVLESQKRQLHNLNKTVNGMREKMAVLVVQLEKAEENAVLLSERSKVVLQASNDLFPRITLAEYDYFQDLQRLNRKVDSLQKSSEKLKSAALSRCRALDTKEVAITSDRINPQKMDTANKILKGENLLLDKTRKLLKEKEEEMKIFQQNAGLII